MGPGAICVKSKNAKRIKNAILIWRRKTKCQFQIQISWFCSTICRKIRHTYVLLSTILPYPKLGRGQSLLGPLDPPPSAKQKNWVITI